MVKKYIQKLDSLKSLETFFINKKTKKHAKKYINKGLKKTKRAANNLSKKYINKGFKERSKNQFKKTNRKNTNKRFKKIKRKNTKKNLGKKMKGGFGSTNFQPLTDMYRGIGDNLSSSYDTIKGTGSTGCNN
jgi:hypothetical protein